MLRHRLKDERKGAKLSQAELAELSGVSQQMISKLETGRAEATREIIALAEALGVSPRWLLTGEGGRSGNDRSAQFGDNVSQGPDIRGFVPLISWVQAGHWHEAQDEYEPGEGEEWMACPMSHGPHTYALRVQGDSMTAPHGKSVPDGSVIYADPDQAGGAVSGDLVIAKINGEDRVTFKQLVLDGSRRFLRPLNSQYPLITDEFKVLAKVIASVTKL